MFGISRDIATDLAKLAELSPATVSLVAAALSRIPVTPDQGGKIYGVILDELRREFSSDDDAVATAQTIEAVYLMYGRSGSPSAPAFLTEMSNAIKEAASTGVFPAEKANSVESVLAQLLSVRSLLVGYKAALLQLEHQDVYSTARIITDIRPVFSDQIADPLATTIIVHNLKIEYWQSGQRLEFFVALDAKDLADLEQVIKRAKDKAQLVRAIVTEKLSSTVFEFKEREQ